jgi:AhpD family alkylhydroperoxidase
MSVIEVFDPPMCCSTGVCGPSVDPALATFAGDLGALADQGVSVTRYNLSQEPKAFAEDSMVRELLHERGDDVLPVVRVNGVLRSSGRYPTRDELNAWAGAEDSGVLDAVTAELVALGAAVGANCETCLKFHFNKARLLGVSITTMNAAIRLAQTVKEAPATSILALAAKLLGTTPDALGVTKDSADHASDTVTTSSATSQSDAETPCCSPASTEASAQSTSDVTAESSSCCGGSETDDSVTVGVAMGVKDQGSACCG